MTGIPKKLMEIHTNERLDKTGQLKDELSDEQEIIELDTCEEDKSSNFSHDTPDANKPFSMSDWLDTEHFPTSENSMLLSWHKFTTGFLGLDKKLDDNIKDICEKHQDKMVDFRPYMIENVHKVTRFDYLPLILQTFQQQHLRHLIVVNPINSKLEGVITRQDIFMFMPL